LNYYPIIADRTLKGGEMEKADLLKIIRTSIAFWYGILNAPPEYRARNPKAWHVVARKKLSVLLAQEARLLTEL